MLIVRIISNILLSSNNTINNFWFISFVVRLISNILIMLTALFINYAYFVRVIMNILSGSNNSIYMFSRS